MSKWERIQLGNILKLSDEKSISQDQFPVLTSSRSGLSLQSDYFKKIVASKNNIGYKIIRNGQFTYRAMSDDGYFKFNRLVNQTVGIISPAYEVFEVNKNVANATFIYYLLNSESISPQVYFFAQGGTRLALRFDDLAKFIVKLPPLLEQKKIAEILFNLDHLIEIKKAKFEKIEKLYSALINRFLSRGISNEKLKETALGRLPESWRVTNLGSLGEFSKGKGIPKSEIKTSGAPCVRYAEIYTDYEYVIKKIKSFISYESINKTKRLKKNDILFAGSGETISDIGKSVAFTLDSKVYAGGDIVIFSPNNQINSGFLAYQLNSNNSRKQLRKFGQGSSIMHIYSSSLEKLLIGIPEFVEQEKIYQRLSSISQGLDLIQKELNQLKFLKKSLIQDLISGQKMVNI